MAVLVIDLQGNIRECNQRFADMLQYVQRDLVGHCYFDFVHPSQQALARRGSGMLTDPSVEVFRPSGPTCARMVRACSACSRAPPPGQSGGDDVILAIISDISELRHAEAQRIERDEAAGGVQCLAGGDDRFRCAAQFRLGGRQRCLGTPVPAASGAGDGATGAEMGLWA